MSDHTLSVHFPGGKRVNAKIGDFEIATDQSRENGGDASAPEPFEYFLASLATCAGIYVLGFCQKRGIPTDGIRLTQSWDFEGDQKKLTEVNITIEVPPDFPEKYHGALVRVAEKCKVKKTLDDPPQFKVETVVTEGATT